MYGWCEKCDTLIIDGLCPIHGTTRPLSHVSNIELRPISAFEKQFFNDKIGMPLLSDGIFFLFTDRMYRRKVITREFPVAEVQLLKGDIIVTPLTKNSIKGFELTPYLEANRPHVDRLARVTKDFAEWELRHSDNAVISFSGGKDSVVLAHLLSSFNLKKVFIDTRLEFPETYDLIKRTSNNGAGIDTVRAESNFFSLCKEKGFPKTGNRWCCKTQKFEPFAKYLSEKYGDQEVSVFSGERRWEGMYRMTQPLRKAHKHIPTQQTIQPLLDWRITEIWCYIWDNNLEVNSVYDYFDRAGCWICPFGLEYRIFMLQYTHPKLYNTLISVGGATKRSLRRAVNRNEKPPCKMELDGKMVNTCEVYGHFFIDGVCYRCGAEGESIMTHQVSPALVGK